MRSIRILPTVLFISLLFQNCNVSTPQEPETNVNPLKYTELAITYTQQSAEYRALCFQSYNLATYKLQEKLKNYKSNKKPAVVLDIDETILDNSPYNVWCLRNGVSYTSETWKNWTELAQADTIAGVGAFLKLADQLGVQLFYVSNRKISELSATMLNMKKYNLPQTDSTHFFLRTAESNKENRRQEVLKNHEILLLVGDNLNDFSEAFEEKLQKERFEVTNQHQYKFGADYIVLPNTIYGSWENAIYGYDTRLSEAQKDSVRNALMRGF